MFRLLKYIVLFFLGYKIIQLLFGSKDKSPSANDNTTPIRNDSNQSRHPDEGEYIEYEEVK